MRLLTFLFILLTALPAGADSDPANGAVVLTVTGNIPQTHHGPLWLAFDLPSDRPATKKQEGKWPWAIFLTHMEWELS
ncbi:MAG: hypothetical protein CBC23_011600 [Rhodospirillaceae bacterium TMED63]|nr:MAG: hypothetical protein CBC23_011600 [Rhodospirillaceae bacterium TMED63]